MNLSIFHQGFKQLIDFKLFYRLACPFINELFNVFVLASLIFLMTFVIFIGASNGEPSKYSFKLFVISSRFYNHQIINKD